MKHMTLTSTEFGAGISCIVLFNVDQPLLESGNQRKNLARRFTLYVPVLSLAAES